MKIKVLKSLAGVKDGERFTYGKGAEVDAPSPIAKDLIKAGLAEPIATKRKKTKKAETAALDVDDREIDE